MTTPNDRLLEAVRGRARKSTEFGYGILLASDYVKSLQDAIGLQACYQNFANSGKGTWASFDDVLRKAAQTLVYSNPEMEVEDRWEKRANGSWGLPSGIEAPKNTLMVFRHVLTTSTKDRDGDILRTKGARPDPKMLLLFNHIHTSPIGKFLGVAERTDKVLKPWSAIVDMNDLCHDCAVMVDNDMGRFSHGFRAIDFLEIKVGRGDDSPGGYDVKEFEIMEESLVSVPANPDAQTEEVMLSLVEGGKMKSGVMREYGKSIRDRRSIRVPVTIDLKTTVNGREVKDADESGDEAGAGRRGEARSSKEADEGAAGKEREGAANEEVKKAQTDDSQSGWQEVKLMVEEEKMTCPECEYEGKPKEGMCPKCGAEMEEMEEKMKPKKSFRPPGGKPYPNEHAIRIDDPGKYAKIRRQNDKFGEGVHAIFGVTEDGKAELQAIRFSADKFTAEEAKKWLEEHEYNTNRFEPAREQAKDHALEKVGRVLSKANESKIKEAKDDVEEASKMEGVSRPCKALLKQAGRGLSDVLASLGEEGGGVEKERSVREAMAFVLAKAGVDDLLLLKEHAEAFEQMEKASARIKQYRKMVGGSS